MTRRLLVLPVLAIALCLVASSLAQAQVYTASLRGKVVDAGGAALPAAKVTVVQVETNFTKSVQSGPAGQYYLPGLPPGLYEITAEAAGFSKNIQAAQLTVGMEAGLDFTMQVAGVSETVEVNASSAPIELTRADVGQTVRKAEIDNLPTIDRSFSSLAMLAPGVSAGVGGTEDSLTMNGQRGYQNNVFVDGMSNQSQLSGAQASSLSQDWIQEFQVMTNSYSSEFGNASGGVLNVVTRSGTNSWNGRGYGFYRTKGLDSTPFAGTFENGDPDKPVFLESSDVPDYNQWRWGGSIGGPVIKNELFVFAGYEGLSLKSNATLALSDYWRKQGYQTVVPIKTTNQPFLLRADYNMGERNRLMVRYDRSILKSYNEGDQYTVESARVTNGGPVWNLVGDITTVLSNNSFNEFRIGYQSNKGRTTCNAAGAGGSALMEMGPAGTYATIMYPTLRTGCPSSSGMIGEENLKLADTFAYVRGSHQFKVGADVRMNALDVDAVNFHQGVWQFSRDMAYDPSNLATYPIVFLGIQGTGKFRSPQWNMSLFALDNWQIRDDLTLNLGVRYDIDRSVTAGNEFVDAKNAIIVQRLGGAPPLSKINVDFNNVAPRLSFAWTPTKDRRTKIHGAVGLFYDQNHGNFNAIYVINSLLSKSTNILVAVNPAYNPYWDGTTLGVLRLMMALGQSYPYFPTIPGMTVPESLDTVDPNLQVPYTQQYTGGIDHQFGSGLVVSATVVHSRGSGLEYISQNYKLEPNGSVSIVDKRFANINELQNVGFVHYTALQTQARYRKGPLNLTGSYTWSKAYSNLTRAGITGSTPTNPFDLDQDLGPDDTDLRHNVVFSAAYNFPLGFQAAGIGMYRTAGPWSVTTNQNPTGAVFPPRPEPKNSRRGDDFSTVDLRVSKVFGLGPQVRCTFFWEGYNLFNTLNYTAYNGLKESPTFGLPSAAAERRRQQVGLRIDF